VKLAPARPCDEAETTFQMHYHWLSRATFENAEFASASQRLRATHEGLETFAAANLPKEVFEGIAKLVGTMNELQTEVNRLRTSKPK
jgi:hypothetical protein